MKIGWKAFKKSEKGQVSIMVGVMMMTFLFFFAFVINTGMLVNAKINLQNAADLAAYAGASVQARQLTQIGYLNYEMRRQWKKFLFRVYVIGNMAEKGFQTVVRGGGQGAMNYSPDGTTNYGKPVTCIIFNAADNYCQITSLPPIQPPPQTFLDQITDTLRGQLQAIEQIRKANCMSIGLTNLIVSLFWLYNADPTMSQFMSSGALTPDQQNVVKIIQGLAYGMGIVPKEILLRFRIQTLADYVNTKAQLGVTKEKLKDLQTSVDPVANERTIQAFLSAFYTLGNHTFPSETISMDELLPGSSSAASLIQLQNINQKIGIYAIDFPGLTADTSSQACNATLVPISLAKEMTVGVYKDPTILTYYAVRLKATARVLFSPFGDIEMKAYAAAQPFGSRIGPAPQNVQFGTSTSAADNSPPLPNLPVGEDDAASQGSGWDKQEVIRAMYGFLTAGGAGASGTITADDMERAYQPAMAPNPWEANRYSIINDLNDDAFVRNFGTDQNAAFWAPVFAPDKLSKLHDSVTGAVNSLFGSVTGNTGTGGISAIQQTLQAGIENYVSSLLPAGKGENGEGVNIVRIKNPFVIINGGIPTPISGDPKIFLTDPQKLKSSWNEVNDGNFRKTGRVGYSVKFVSFDSLTKHKLSTDGQTSWTNALPTSEESDQDILFLKH